MMPTIRTGSYSVVSRASYGYSRYSFDSFELPIAGRWPALMPQRGDVVVFRLPRDHKTQYVKRVVGLPGDRIQMIKGRLSINGALVPVEPASESAGSPGEKRTVPIYVEKLPGETSYHIAGRQPRQLERQPAPVADLRRRLRARRACDRARHRHILKLDGVRPTAVP